MRKSWLIRMNAKYKRWLYGVVFEMVFKHRRKKWTYRGKKAKLRKSLQLKWILMLEHVRRSTQHMVICIFNYRWVSSSHYLLKPKEIKGKWAEAIPSSDCKRHKWVSCPFVFHLPGRLRSNSVFLAVEKSNALLILSILKNRQSFKCIPFASY